MPKCPHCGEEIEWLDQLITVREHNEVVPGETSFNKSTSDADEPDERYECPKCDELIASSFGEAQRFWNGEETTDESGG